MSCMNQSDKRPKDFILGALSKPRSLSMWIINATVIVRPRTMRDTRAKQEGCNCKQFQKLKVWRLSLSTPHAANTTQSLNRQHSLSAKKSHLIVLYVVFKLDESYTPSKVSILAGDGFHNLKEIKTVELVKPTGWVYLSLSGADPSTMAFQD
ncbi:hypothetical protein JHK87_027845 [Glycine soja]|nr:hypothetical protein JHK87_027845 [Glycine soja]